MDTNSQHNELVGVLNSERENGPEEDTWDSWHMPKRHLGLRLSLLQHSGMANRTPDVSLRINCSSRSTFMLTWCCLAHRQWRTITVHSDGWCTRAHISHRWNSSSSGHSKLRHHQRHTRKKNIHYNNFPMAEERNSSREEWQSIPPLCHVNLEVYMTICIIWHVLTYIQCVF